MAQPASAAPASDLKPTLGQLRIERGGPGKSKSRRPWGWIITGGVALLAVGGWMLSPHPIAVQTAAVVTSTPSQQFVELTASGYVVAQRRAAVASKATGRLVELYVREGSKVRKGDLLAKLDASDVLAAMAGAEAGVRQAQAGVRQAEVELINAQADLTRTQGLQAQGFVSPQAVDAIQTRVNAAKAQLASAQAGQGAAQAQVKVQKVAESFTEIRAPFDGVVLVKNANVGDVITPLSSAAGTQGAVVTMADMSTLEVEADVSESSLSKARIGQPVEILLDALPGVRMMGTVGGIVPTVDRAKATVTTKIRFDKLDPRILPEMSAKVSFLNQAITVADQQPVLAVNPSAVTTVGDAKQVWRIRSEGPADAPKLSVQAVAVKPGRKLAEVLEITPVRAGELKSGDKVVLNAPASLKADALVKQAEQ